MIQASRSFRKSVTSLVALGVVLSGAPLHAQSDPMSGSGEQSTSGQLNLPANPEFFGKNDPNNRRATAIVNGEIVTGTDVDQRLALILAANGNKVSPEEKERLRLQILRNLIDETLQIQEAKATKLTRAFRSRTSRKARPRWPST
jgi:peptidyl-prolyl cis-trans isomerase SurA